MLSGGIGVALGAIHANLALRPLLSTPLRIAPRKLVLRFLLRILILTVLLVLLTSVGTTLRALLPCLVGGFVLQSVVIVWRSKP